MRFTQVLQTTFDAAPQPRYIVLGGTGQGGSAMMEMTASVYADEAAFLANRQRMDFLRRVRGQVYVDEAAVLAAPGATLTEKIGYVAVVAALTPVLDAKGVDVNAWHGNLGSVILSPS